MRPSPTKPLQIYWKQRVGDFRPFSAHAEPEYHVCFYTPASHTTNWFVFIFLGTFLETRLLPLTHLLVILFLHLRECASREMWRVPLHYVGQWTFCDTVTSKATRLFPWLSYFCRLSPSWLHCNHLSTLDWSCSDVLMRSCYMNAGERLPCSGTFAWDGGYLQLIDDVSSC